MAALRFPDPTWRARVVFGARSRRHPGRGVAVRDLLQRGFDVQRAR